jgi:hypothetical protein
VSDSVPQQFRSSSASSGPGQGPQTTPAYYSVIRCHAELTTPAILPLQSRKIDRRGSDASSALCRAPLRCKRRQPGIAQMRMRWR